MRFSKEQFYGLVFMLLGAIWMSNLSRPDIVEVDEQEMNRVLAEADSTIELLDELIVELDEMSAEMDSINDNFEYAHPKFQVFNPNIDSATTYQFASVMNFYSLDDTEYKRKMYTGQILLESGAKQYKNGKLLLSSAGAVGFCQIMPNTCRGYMQKYMDSTDIEDFYNLGATDFSFAFSDSLSIAQKNKKASEWLSNADNNIIMWGFITRNNLDRKGDIHKQLVSYNLGTGGMQSYVSNGGNCVNHHYIDGIRTKLSVASH